MFCCDPGLVSGIGVLHWDPERGVEKVEAFEGSLAEVGESAEVFLRGFPAAEAEVVIERFVITTRTGTLSSPDWSLKVCGALEWLVWKHWKLLGDDAIAYQSVSAAKQLVPNDVLRSAGVWHRGGAGHANDALRHGIFRYATKYRMTDAWDDLG
jgi:hypothetical protein